MFSPFFRGSTETVVVQVTTTALDFPFSKEATNFAASCSFSKRLIHSKRWPYIEIEKWCDWFGVPKLVQRVGAKPQRLKHMRPTPSGLHFWYHIYNNHSHYIRQSIYIYMCKKVTGIKKIIITNNLGQSPFFLFKKKKGFRKVPNSNRPFNN